MTASPPPATTPGTSGLTQRPAAATQGDNWIVLAHHQGMADLEAAKIYFANNGIATEIYEVEDVRREFARNGLNPDALPSGGGYLLATPPNRLYENPGTIGSDGYLLKQRIAELGADYRPPPGLESFAPNRFSDAYGMKIR